MFAGITKNIFTQIKSNKSKLPKHMTIFFKTIWPLVGQNKKNKINYEEEPDSTRCQSRLTLQICETKNELG